MILRFNDNHIKPDVDFSLQADQVKSEDVPLEILRRSLNLVSTKEEAEDIRLKIDDILKVCWPGFKHILIV